MPFSCLTLTAPKPKPEGYPEHPLTLGEHLRKRRMDLGLQKRQVAEKIGVAPRAIYAWETGGSQPLNRYWPEIVVYLGYDPRVGQTASGRVTAVPSAAPRR